MNDPMLWFLSPIELAWFLAFNSIFFPSFLSFHNPSLVPIIFFAHSIQSSPHHAFLRASFSSYCPYIFPSSSMGLHHVFSSSMLIFHHQLCIRHPAFICPYLLVAAASNLHCILVILHVFHDSRQSIMVVWQSHQKRFVLDQYFRGLRWVCFLIALDKE